MGSTHKRRTSGAVRELPSGKWQARVLDIATGKHVALGTFSNKADADRELAAATTDQGRGNWVDPRRGDVSVKHYATAWLENRPELRPGTRQLYEGVVKRHIVPHLGQVKLGRLTPETVRQWHAGLVRELGPESAMVAKSYRTLRAILNTAVEDGVIVRNPCIIRNAGVEHAAERPVATPSQVYALAEAVPPRYAAAVLLAAHTGLRFGELAALRRNRVDLMHGVVTVTETLVELADGSLLTGPPKTEAGKRTVAFPSSLTGVLEHHLTQYAGAGVNALMFIAPKGGPLRRTHFGRVWRKAAASVGLEGFRFHDLRHSSNTWAAATGASTRELMARMGHSSPRAALLYQHATLQRDRTIADAMDAYVRGELADQSAASDNILPMRGGV